MTTAIQPVEESIGRSIKSAFRDLIVNHVLRFVENTSFNAQHVFKIYKAVTIYDGVVMMVQVWRMVPKSVILNGWLRCKISATFKDLQVLEIHEDNKGLSEPARKPQVCKIFNKDYRMDEKRCTDEKRKGKECLEGNYSSMYIGKVGTAVLETFKDSL